MGALAWVMMAIAIWHFTVFLPDRFWGGIVGALLCAVAASALFGLIVSGFTVPGRDDTDLVAALEAIPGSLIGLAFAYFYGAAQDRKAGIDRPHL
jgi:thiol:disulfide interchange protein